MIEFIFDVMFRPEKLQARVQEYDEADEQPLVVRRKP